MVLYFLAFLTFGIADGITGGYMMEIRGPYMESNPILRDLFIIQGFDGMLFVKLLSTLMLLLVIHIYENHSRENIYWTVNGTIIAIISEGVMGMYYNTRAINGEIPPSPGQVIFIFAAMVLIFIEIGAFIDKRIANKP